MSNVLRPKKNSDAKQPQQTALRAFHGIAHTPETLLPLRKKHTQVSDKSHTVNKTYYISIIVASLLLVQKMS